jgi:hypothetical protein
MTVRALTQGGLLASLQRPRSGRELEWTILLALLVTAGVYLLILVCVIACPVSASTLQELFTGIARDLERLLSKKGPLLLSSAHLPCLRLCQL